MSSQGNGQQKTYRVVQIGPVKKALAQQYERAKVKGQGAAFVAALEHVYNRLRLDPHGFGEPKYTLHAMGAVVYVGIHDPLVVEFGIHKTAPLVMIRSVKYMEGP